jgi:hypothetical protein
MVEFDASRGETIGRPLNGRLAQRIDGVAGGKQGPQSIDSFPAVTYVSYKW